jgi:DNA-binding NarL/FixJ family response regulator
MHVVAQCENAEDLLKTLTKLRGCVVLFPTSLSQNLTRVLDAVRAAQGKAVVIVEHGMVLDDAVAARAEGVVLRSVTGPQLVDCLRRISAGEVARQRAIVRAMPSSDAAGERILARLTPRELQVMALVTDGLKNRQIAERLGTKEQVVKNYLRAIYDKTGASDRLELALFTRHHLALAEATGLARNALARRTSPRRA